jgi:hypothetical protein
MCKWYLGFSFIVLHKDLITFFIFSPHSWIFNANFNFIRIFGKFLGIGFLECPKVPLIHEQTFLPIFKGGVGFVSTDVITSAMYLGIFVGMSSVFVGGYRGE